MEGNNKKETYRWTILTIVYLSILAFTFIFQSIPPILPLIISDLRINYAQSGLLMGLFALPGLFISLPGGFLSDRYRIRPLGIFCFLLMLVGSLLVGLGRDLRALWWGRFISGMGGLTLSVLLPKMISQWFRERDLGFAMGIFNTGVPLGSVICFGLFGGIGNGWGWRIPILFTVLYTLTVSILFITLYRTPSLQPLEGRKSSGLYKSLKEMGWPIWWVGFSWLWFNAAFVSFATFAPQIFLAKGFTLEQSGILIGIPLLGSLFLSPPVGYMVDRFRHQEWVIGIGATALTLLAFSFHFSSSFFTLVILMAIFSAMIPSPIYSLPPEILKPENVGLGFGVISTCSSFGLFFAPSLAGKIKDLTESDDSTLILVSIFFFLTLFSILLFHRLRNKNHS